LGEFEVTRSLGSGSYGKVKLVRNVLNGSVVAVKIVNRFAVEARTDASHPDHRRAVTLDKRVAREANLSQVLGGLHPNIVPLELLRVTERHFYLFYRYIDGMNLADLVNLAAENSNSSGITGGIGERLARPLIRQVIETVAFCHAHSVVHRDIKLDNLMVDNTGRVHLIDFGLAHFYAQESQLKTFCGSLPYTAPELIRGLKYTGPEVDVWSLGVTLYRLVLGRFPFGDPMDDACWAQILASEFPAPPVHECTQTFHDLLRRMLRASPRSRAPLALIMMHPW
ncbi:kinase-like protein, partial [Ramicandelaber brevisporus]